MKYILFFFFPMLVNTSLFCQLQNKLFLNDTTLEIETKPDTKATFNGNWKSFIKKNIDKGLNAKLFDERANRNIKAIYAEKKLTFIVDTFGNINNIKIFDHVKKEWVLNKNNNDVLSKEAIRLIILSQPWIPATINNKKVKTETNAEITFSVWFH